jgi:hypothetical protein
VKTFFFSFLISSLSTLASTPNEVKTAENLNKTILDAENEVFFDGKLGKLVATPECPTP